MLRDERILERDYHLECKGPLESGFIAYLKISTPESRFKKLWIRMPDSPDTCGRKSYPERKSWGFKNTWICVDGAWITCPRICLTVLSPLSVVMSQYTLIGSPEEDGLIQYSPSPTVASLCRMSLHEWPGAQFVEPFFTKIRKPVF